MFIVPLWLCSIATSFGLEATAVFRIFKSAADQGYKINVEKLKKVAALNAKSGNTFKSLLIPGVNISKAVKSRDEMVLRESATLRELAFVNALEKMTLEERIIYSQRPTTFTALVIAANSEQKTPMFTGSVDLDDNSGSIKYEYTTLEDVRIVGTYGRAEELADDEIRSIVMSDIIAKEISNFIHETEDYKPSVGDKDKSAADLFSIFEEFPGFKQPDSEEFEKLKEELKGLTQELFSFLGTKVQDAKDKISDQVGPILKNTPKDDDKKD